MSRIGNKPVTVPNGVDLKINGSNVTVKGGKGELTMNVHSAVSLKQADNVVTVVPNDGSKQARAMSGTMRALINNMVVGVSEGFSKRLQLNGVGYRAKASGKTLNLTLGFSHPIDYTLPDGITVETPSNTEIVVSGADKQRVGQVAAEIRAFRAPEPYKGKGVRYADEYIRRKETKKK
ncbi:50S ribosomal protein L6 [Natronospirillum operosum]|uniref:Large ribosomal subunit protein uL6 n=1 Tax=Natronospirillum operosum TaxID=2759953 RepID=A0A4Z0W4E9_9GAMM|nr:50S ribosomal protein L6 [Natronospirillum operosum]TGG90183.1 50S ribosomal protein L6 [Natronospirillum operosum]